MNPHRPGSSVGRDRGDGDRGVGAIVTVSGHAVLGEQRSEERLATRSDQQRPTELTEPIQMREQRPVVSGGLGEADARVEHDLIEVDSGLEDGVEADLELGAHLADDVARSPRAVASARCGRANA